jgi:nanoRNase/pAp phosphatase (c-di-AMP/oligoRNAs hydrolase)
MHPDFQEYILSPEPHRIVLIHHWDVDGLASAALILQFAQQHKIVSTIELFAPTVNNYFLENAEFERIAALNPDAVVVVDYNIPLDNIERLEQIAPLVFVFDHHVQTADINRPGLQDTNYPGCSMLVSDYLMQPLSIAAVLGMVGDQEELIQQRTDFYPSVEQMMTEYALTFDQLLRITKLLDTSYIVDDAAAMRHSIDLIRQYCLHMTDPQAVLNDPRLLAQETEIKKDFDHEVSSFAKATVDKGSVILYHTLQTRFSLISEVTRALARTHADKIMITSQRRGAQASLYVRSRIPGINLTPIVDAARAHGFNAGGKPEVAGVVLPSDQVDAFVEEVTGMLQ